jgi:hypothetical protein
MGPPGPYCSGPVSVLLLVCLTQSPETKVGGKGGSNETVWEETEASHQKPRWLFAMGQVLC